MDALDLMPLDASCVLHGLFFHKTKTRNDLLKFEKIIKEMPGAFDKCPYPLFHSFADGMYTREIHIPMGHLAVGKIHRNDYFVNLLKGKLWVVSEFDSKQLIAPCSFTAKAGVKHIVFILEDAVWSDTHKTDKTTIEEAEKEIFVDSYEEFDKYNKVYDVEYELCLSHKFIEKMAKTDDLIVQPFEDNVEIKRSSIDGLGAFTTSSIKQGGKVALCRSGENRTPVGRYTNHSDSPNVKAVIDGNNGYFYALIDIDKNSELLVDYRDVREKAKLLDRCELCQAG